MTKADHIGIVAAVTALLIFTGCPSEQKEAAKTGTRIQAAPSAGTETAQTTCPVMGGPINKKFYADHQGKRIYFCCSACISAFRKEPEKYLKKLEAGK